MIRHWGKKETDETEEGASWFHYESNAKSKEEEQISEDTKAITRTYNNLDFPEEDVIVTEVISSDAVHTVAIRGQRVGQ